MHDNRFVCVFFWPVIPPFMQVTEETHGKRLFTPPYELNIECNKGERLGWIQLS